MKRLAVSAVLALVMPIVAWRVVSAETPAPAIPCPPATADPAVPTVPTASPDPVTCVATVVPTESTTTTTIDPLAPDPNATTTTTIDPAATTSTTIDPNATTTTTTIDPAATTSTTIDPNATTSTTVVEPTPAPTTTTTPAVVEEPATTVATTVPEEVESAPVAPPPPSEGGRVFVPAGVAETGQVRPIAFPVAGPVRYWNDFGACRAGCSRQHKGNDIIGDRLQPVLAMRDGVVDRLLDHPTAGFGIVIQDAEGWEYHVYHVNNDTPGTDDGADDGAWRFPPGIMPGARVTAGQVVAWMGDSGNSEGSVPHAHVEIHTPSGAAINPFWSLRMAQRDVNCAIPAAPAAQPAAFAPVSLADLGFLATGWSSPEVLATLPGGWSALALTGGRPGSDTVAARMWIGANGFTPVDAAAVQAGDRRYDEDCTQPTTVMAPANIPAELGAILATIRAMETGGNYTTQVTSSTASGAYAFLDSSWGGYGGYRRARDAPPPVQDAKAAELATYILNKNGGDVSTVPVSWYIGDVPVGAEWDTVPPVGANVITPREYQARWMAMYARVLGTPEVWVGTAPAWLPLTTTVACRTVVVDLGDPGQPEYGLTQARTFTTDISGRAVPAAGDPCDPHRVPVEPPAPVLPPLRPTGPS